VDRSGTAEVVAHPAFVVGEWLEDIDAVRAHDGQLERPAVDADRLLAYLGRGHLGAGLHTDEHRARLGGRKRIDRLAAAFGQRVQECLRVVFDPGAARDDLPDGAHVDRRRQPDGNTNKAHENVVGFQHSAAGWSWTRPVACRMTHGQEQESNDHTRHAGARMQRWTPLVTRPA
jgi:hypothetical protein